MSRVEVKKTYKLFVGGGFPRSESGRCYDVTDAGGRFLANAAMGSRKDVRDAVVKARAAQPGWAKATAYNRGQVLAAAEGVSAARARAVVDSAIDRWVWYAGWTDKFPQVLGSVNPVAGPYFNISAPEPTGVVAALAPQQSSLLGLVSVLAPIIASGNTAVVVTSERRPIPAITLAETLATSDVPAGVVNLLTGITAELAPWLASHRDVNAIDLTGVGGTDLDWAALERAAAENLKRVLRPQVDASAAIEPDFAPTPGLTRLVAFLETKTVWHPKGR